MLTLMPLMLITVNVGSLCGDVVVDVDVLLDDVDVGDSPIPLLMTMMKVMMLMTILP